MNSEELELSLRSEFESYLKGVFAGMQQDVADFQKNFEAEFDKHRAQMDEAMRNLTTRFESEVTFDRPFTESVVEHLRLARDDGAQLTAHAFSEAQKLESGSAAASYDRLRDAINEISSQTTQASILKSLVDQASNFTSRGAFFIVKHDSFVCWRKFDHGVHADDDSVRSIHFPLGADTLLANSVSSLSTRDNSNGGYAEDGSYLQALGFGEAEKMYAVPLVARGRGVAVLYADQPAGGDPVSLEAIESLVRVAGLTVELRAASAAAPAPEAPTYVPMQPAAEAVAEAEPEAVAAPVEEETDAYTGSDQGETVEEYTGAVSYDDASEGSEPEYAAQEEVHEIAVEEVSYPEAVEEETAAYEVETTDQAPVEIVNDFAFASSDAYDASAETEPEPAEEYAYSGEATNGANGNSYAAVPDAVVEVGGVQANKSRLSERNVDLPIEVSDDERRFHNDARRFARLLVSEIKLYNEQKVTEGRNSGDLYDRLREAIDRSREMYDKRVKPQVAAKFDYFHYELVSNLAQGNDATLGGSYPGANV